MSTTRNQEGSGKITVLQERLHLIGIFVLVAGLLSSVLIYATAAADSGRGAIGYDVVDGKSYPIMAGDSKSYQYNLERIGGKSAVLGAEFDDWFGGLWHGRKLAYTLGCLSVGSSLICFFFAHFVIFPPPSDNPYDRKER